MNRPCSVLDFWPRTFRADVPKCLNKGGHYLQMQTCTPLMGETGKHLCSQICPWLYKLLCDNGWVARVDCWDNNKKNNIKCLIPQNLVILTQLEIWPARYCIFKKKKRNNIYVYTNTKLMFHNTTQCLLGTSSEGDLVTCPGYYWLGISSD